MGTTKKKPLRNYNFYLIKKEKTELKQIIDLKNDLAEYKIRKGSDFIGTLYLKKPIYRPPVWAHIFLGYIDIKTIGEGGSPSALLLLTVKQRIFVITFGYGRYLLVKDSWEDRFGLTVALNIIQEDGLKSLDKKSFDSISLITREQANKEIKVEEFGLDIEKDLLSAVVGLSKDKTLGEKVSGMDSFKTAVRAELDELKGICENILEKSEGTAYKERYPWVDHLSEVKDGNLVSRLDDEIVKFIRAENYDKCWTCIPEIIDWNEIEGFKYSFNSRSPIYYDIHLPEFLEEKISENEVDIEKIKNRNVYAVDANHNKIKEWSIYKCIYSEVSVDDKTFVISGGKWYEIENNFVQLVNESFDRINKCKLNFPEFNHNSENEYNKFVNSQSDDYALMDREIVYLEGNRNKIEFCDLYEKDGYLIHVKRYASSSVLSHLFMQGIVAAELFQLDSSFREKVNEKLPASHKLSNVNERPLTNDYEIVYAIISDSKGDKLDLPFFSKLTLRNAVRRLNGLGFRVSIKKIQVEKNKKHLKKLPPG